MVAIVDYASLQTAIVEWLWRTGDTQVTGRVADFVSMFEFEFALNPDMRTLEMQELSTVVITAAAVPLPTDFIEMERLQVLGTASAPNIPLDYRTPTAASVIDANASNLPGNGTSYSANSAGTVGYYMVLAGQIILTPQATAPSNT